jgi:tetratricopeptide (TPR) repeat protein
LTTATRTTNNDSKDLSRQEGIKLLIDYLDSYYIDAEGWLLLCKSYSELGLYKQALDCSSHSILIQPQNCFLLLYHAELNFTLGGESYETALKEFLRVIEMSTDLNEQPRLIGCGRRAAFGAKTVRRKTLSPSISVRSLIHLHIQCISRLWLLKTSPSSSTTTTFSDSKLQELEIMLTRLLLASYQGSSTNREELKTVREWLEK